MLLSNGRMCEHKTVTTTTFARNSIEITKLRNIKVKTINIGCLSAYRKMWF